MVSSNFAFAVCLTSETASSGSYSLVRSISLALSEYFLSLFHGYILLVVKRVFVPPTILFGQSTTTTPIERAVPAIMLMAASSEAAFRSGIFSSAISFT